ncbi:MAG: HypC/HybG/HupF family hydrogenase formation chaperone [Syntrophomonas sp.]
MCLAVPGRIVELIENNMARIDIAGNLVEASVRLAPQAKVGDYVLLHAGFVMEIIDETLAKETISTLRELEQSGL